MKFEGGEIIVSEVVNKFWELGIARLASVRWELFETRGNQGRLKRGLTVDNSGMGVAVVKKAKSGGTT